MPIGVRFLRWVDVDPSTHAFDLALARSAAEATFVARPANNQERMRLEHALTSRLVEHYGAWVLGWTWSASEPGGGGPIHAWCCDTHSIFAKGEKSAAPTVERAVAAVAEWRAFLEQLAQLFDELHAATDDDLARLTEHAASRLAVLVLERTHAEDAWYATFTQLLRWFLEACGHEPLAAGAVETVVKGRFESWCTPEDTTIAATAHALGDAVTREPAIVDSLAMWLAQRESAVSYAIEPVARPVTRDAHRDFITTHDHARDPQRAQRMLTALAACRASAARGEPLTPALLASWHADVLGEEPVWRTTDAFARHVRYRYRHDLHAQFAAALAQAEGDEPLYIRAARLYLDVCFFHAFTNGNARAARLALDHLLTRAGFGLHAVEPLFVIARATDDPYAVYSLASMLRLLVGPRM